jgi:hypothetical protein
MSFRGAAARTASERRLAAANSVTREAGFDRLATAGGCGLPMAISSRLLSWDNRGKIDNAAQNQTRSSTGTYPTRLHRNKQHLQ